MNRMEKMWRHLTPEQRLWSEVFGFNPQGIPDLDGARVRAMVDALPNREAQAVRLRFGFGGRPQSLQKVATQLPRVNGTVGVSREIVRRELERALRRLRGRRKAWQEAIIGKGDLP